jgi:polyhydroxyalkanoate synthesis repressor PhaR
MIRLIKRYESRKLYDTEESRYVSLEEIAAWVREGQEVKVVDNASGADVTSQTLTQIILDEGRRGTAALPSELLHELVRLGERAVHTGMEQVQHGVDRLMQASIDRLGPVRRAREEMSSLRSRLEQLEASLSSLEVAAAQPVPAVSSLTSTAPNQATPALATTAPAAPGNGSSTPDREAGR